VSIVDEEKYRPISEIKAELERLEEERRKVEERVNKMLGKLI